MFPSRTRPRDRLISLVSTGAVCQPGRGGTAQATSEHAALRMRGSTRASRWWWCSSPPTTPGNPGPGRNPASRSVGAVIEAGVYVLPARFDDSELPGLLPDVVSVGLCR